MKSSFPLCTFGRCFTDISYFFGLDMKPGLRTSDNYYDQQNYHEEMDFSQELDD